MLRGVFLLFLGSCLSIWAIETPKVTSPRALLEPIETNAPVLKFQDPPKFVPGAELSKAGLAAPEYVRAWRKFTSLNEYLRCGKTNAVWHMAAIEALNLYCDLGGLKPGSSESDATTKRVHAAATRAIDAGCDDPLIQFLKWNHTPLDESSEGRWKLTKGALAAAEALENSSYSPIHKSLSAMLACNAARTAVSTDMDARLRMLLRAMIYHMHEALHDPAIPSTVSTNVADVIRLGTRINAETTADLQTVLFSTLEKQCPSRGFAYVLRADYFIHAAWVSRRHNSVESVSEDEFTEFDRCLIKAEDILRKGWEADLKDPKIPARMIDVCLGRSLPRTEMEMWFKRAMALDPNNTDAAFSKVTYLSPEWHGTIQDFVKFGYECANSERWGGRVPLVLVVVHQQVQRMTGAEPAAYYGQAHVWRDLRMSYEKFFRLNPTETETRPKFARDAFYAGEHKLFLEQMEKAGTNVNYYAIFGSPEEFAEMKKKALAAVSMQASVKNGHGVEVPR